MDRKFDRNKARYQRNIIRQIKNRQQEEKVAPVRKLLMTVLNGVNAMDALARCEPAGMLCYGPAGFHGTDWVGAILWYKPSDYHAYKVLTLMGVWAKMVDGNIHLFIGTKTLEFQPPFYNPEGYHRAIKQGFALYYGDDGSPPDEAVCLWTAAYKMEKRLALRSEIEDALKKLAKNI